MQSPGWRAILASPYRHEIFLHVIPLSASLAPSCFQPSRPLATCRLPPLAHKETQISSEKGSLLSLGSASNSALAFFPCSAVSEEYSTPTTSASPLPVPNPQNHENSGFSPPVHHTLASALQTRCWKQPPATSEGPLCRLSILVLLAFSAPLKNSKDQSFLKFYILGFHGIILFQVYSDSDYSIIISYWNIFVSHLLAPSVLEFHGVSPSPRVSAQHPSVHVLFSGSPTWPNDLNSHLCAN